jgi:hypothetical protein
MTLTGKCKEDFDEWYKENRSHSRWVNFELSGESMQYGVYEDWFDSVGITCGIFTYNGYDPIIYRGYVADGGTLSASKSRPEARTAAIEKANEIYNEH